MDRFSRLARIILAVLSAPGEAKCFCVEFSTWKSGTFSMSRAAADRMERMKKRIEAKKEGPARLR